MKKFLIASFLFLILPFSALAAELKFFEFAPDAADYLTVSVVETPYQVFTPYDDYISGFDFWMENTGASGSASFTLLDQNNNSLASKNITVSNTGAVWGGKKFHIQLNQPIKAESFNKYKIKISSSLPKLKLYYSGLVQLLEHNANYSLDKNISPAILGFAEQNFAFKFALYENNDVSAPLILNATSTAISPDKAKISFNANEPVDYKVDNASFYGDYFKCQIDICGQEFSISSGAAYNFRLTVKDIWGNESYYDGSVGTSTVVSTATSTATSTNDNSTSTPPETAIKDTAPPIISDVKIISLEPKKVKIGWKTDEAANSSLLIGLDIGGGRIITSIGDSTYELDHVLTTDEILFPETKYYASITSIDSFGNSAVSTIYFTTPKTSQNQTINNKSPENNQQQELNVTASFDSGRQSINIGWQAPSVETVGGYRIDIFDGNKELVKRLFIDSGIYRAVAEDLPSGEYYAIVYKNNNGVFEKIAKPADFNLAQPVKKSFFFRYFLSAFAGIISIIAILFFAVKRKKSLAANGGFTLLEFMAAIGIFVIIILAVGVFWDYVTDLGIFFFNNLSAQQEINQTFSEMILENRSLGSSSTGSFAVASAGTSTYTFYSDIDSDGLYEQVRYFLQNNILKKGVIKPSGNPLTYNPADEKISEAVHNMDSTLQGIFSYYASSTIENGVMSYPINILNIRMIQIKLVVKPPYQNGTSSFSVFITPRNLKDL